MGVSQLLLCYDYKYTWSDDAVAMIRLEVFKI